MLSNDIIDQLVSISSKLDSMIVSEYNIAEEKISHLKNIIAALSDRHSESSKSDVQILINQLQTTLVELEEVTNNRIEVLDFVKNIAPK
jgi:DNA-binding sugar fermentation-stimulating protein